MKGRMAKNITFKKAHFWQKKVHLYGVRRHFWSSGHKTKVAINSILHRKSDKLIETVKNERQNG